MTPSQALLCRISQGCVNFVETPAVLTMSSREIAELTGKLHTHVLRDIRVMLEGLGVAETKFGSSYIDPTGRSLPCFNLPKRETMILVSGYSVVLRARIIDRWMELTRAQSLTPDLGAAKTLNAFMRLARSLKWNKWAALLMSRTYGLSAVRVAAPPKKQSEISRLL